MSLSPIQWPANERERKASKRWNTHKTYHMEQCNIQVVAVACRLLENTTQTIHTMQYNNICCASICE